MKIINCDFTELKELCRKSKVYPFGSGVVAKEMAILMSENGIQDRIIGYVDNNSSLWGATKALGGKESLIISPKQLCDAAAPDMLVVVACTDAQGVYEQLEEYPELREVRICFWQLALSNEMKRQKATSYPHRSAEQRIPKVIHYCWFGGKPIPEHLQHYMDSWKKMCPDYTIMRWDETNYDVTQNKYMQQAYECKKWGFVPDYARLDILYKHGGIYLDTDVELLKNLDDLLYQDAFCGYDIYGFVNFGIGVASRAGNPVIKELRDEYRDKCFIKPDGSMNQEVCILYQYDTLHRLGLKYDGNYTEMPQMTVYPASVLGSYDPFVVTDKNDKVAVSCHRYDSSWHDDVIREAKKARIRFFEQLRDDAEKSQTSATGANTLID